MDKLKRIMELCKCGIHITINEHRDIYKTAEEALEDSKCLECPPEITDEDRAEMIKRNTIIDVQVYPDTPIGFYVVYHWDIEKAFDEILDALQSKR